MNGGHDAVYLVRTDVAVEDFDDEALLFQAADCKLRGINHLTRDILRSLDGKRDVHAVAAVIAATYEESLDRVLPDVNSILKQLHEDRILKRRCILPLAMGSNLMSTDDKYMVNPDVSCRIEDEDGAILYNSDTDGVQIINPMGLEIWETLSSPHTAAALVAHIKEVCRDVPEAEVGKDVTDFIASMLRKGYLGIVERTDK